MAQGMIVTVVGARPNFMKAAPIHRAFERRGVDHAIVHTGQHYDAAMSTVFFDELGLPEPSLHLGVGSGSHARQTGALMPALETAFEAMRPRMVVVVGDVNSTVAAALVASKMRIPVAHVEAGLRSRDWTMPEEVNRAVTDVLADLLLTPSPDADDNLRAEGRNPERIVRVGNVMIDSLLAHLEASRSRDPWGAIGRDRPSRYGVVTLHRPATVDEPGILAGVWTAMAQIAEDLPLVFAAHPRTRPGLANLPEAPGIWITEPLGYLDFLALTRDADLVLTDSGGLQEETTALGIPCVTLRENTERPITLAEGTNRLAGTAPDAIRAAARDALTIGRTSPKPPALWDGRAAERIADAIRDFLGCDHAALLR